MNGSAVAEGVSPLLRSKLRRPAIPDYFVARPRLEEVFAGVTSRPLTLVIAPAGSGKTQLVANWAVHSSIPIAWLSLEEMDDDPVQLWMGVIAALELLAPGSGDGARDLIANRAPIDDVVRALLAAHEGVTVDDSVLVLDDTHHIKDPTATGSLSLFIQHLPSWLHVVIAGRTDPPFPLDRLRGRGQLAEVRFPQLRFTPSEARQMLARLAPAMSESEIDTSAEYTDGWAAGVQLTALSVRAAQSQPAPVSLRSHVRLMTDDYVWHEVLASGDADVVDLLMRVSVVDRVNSELAGAITGRADAHDLLRRGEAQGLFVHRLGTGDWFRIHPLVRESLLDELVRSSSHRQHHERAARWLEEAGETVSALEQWLQADLPREALRLVSARSTELYDQGREAVIGRTLEAIPREVASTDVPALIDYAVSHILGPLPTFLETVRDVVWHAERTEHDYSPHLDALQAISFTTSGDWTAGSACARRAIAALGGGWWSDPAGRFAWNTAARGVALSESWDDDDRFVRDATIAMSRDPRRGISLEGVRALGHALAGRPVDALRIAAGVRPAASTMSILRVELGIAEALARRELGDRERALSELRAIADDTADPRLFCPVGAMLALALTAVDDGDPAGAAAELGRAEALVAAVAAGPDLQEWVRRAATTVAIAGGDVDAAARSAAAIADPFWGPVSRSRLALALGDKGAAAGELEGALPRCVRHRVILGLLEARAATTPEDVLRVVTPAIELASEHGMLQTVVSEGRELMDVIERTAWRVSDDWLGRLRLAMVPTALPVQLPTREFPELLTERERDVLRLLPSRLTIGEIAKELYVSVNTVKFHLRIIYRKLGVNSREEAAAIARSMTRLARSASR